MDCQCQLSETSGKYREIMLMRLELCEISSEVEVH